MREFLLNNKSKIIKIFLLLAVFLFVVTFINGRSLYNERVKMMQMEKEAMKNKA